VLIGLGCAHLEQDHYAEAQTALGQALRVGRETGNQVLAAMALNGLGLASTHQGDYGGARACYEESLRVSRETGDQRDEGFARSGLCLLAHCQGDDATAWEHGRQALRIAKELGEQLLLGYVLSRLGCALEGLGRLAEAAAAYRQALDIRRTQGQQGQAMETLAGLARVALAQGDRSQAGVYAEEILNHLETKTLEGADEPFRVHLTCYRVLCANQDPRAPAVLRAAHRLLHEQAARIGSEELHRSFLERVPAHREIARACQDQP